MKLLSYVVKLAPVAVAVLSVTNSAAQDPVPLDPKHYTIEVNNRWVRALRVRYGPGEGSPMHDHPAGIVITITPTKSRFQMADGSTSEGRPRPAGAVSWRKPTRHANRSLMNETAEMIEIDLKDLPNGAGAEVTRSSTPDGLETIELENQFARVLHTRIPPQGKTSAHKHSDAVIVVMTDQQLRLTATDGATQERTLKKGQVFWMPAGTLSIENAGTDLGESFIVELKPWNK